MRKEVGGILDFLSWEDGLNYVLSFLFLRKQCYKAPEKVTPIPEALSIQYCSM